MSSVNKVILIGNLGADPEVNHTKSGMAVSNVTLATNQMVSGEETVEWHRVTLWDKNAENAAKYLTKGSKIYIEGRLQTRKYEDKDGQMRYQTEVIANQLTFLDSKPVAADSVKKASKASPKSKRTEDDDLPF